MVRPLNQAARRRYYRQLQAQALASEQALAAAKSGKANPGLNPEHHCGSERSDSSTTCQPECQSFRGRAPPDPNQISEKTGKKQKRKNTGFVQYVYINCEHAKNPEILKNLPAPPVPTPPSTPSRCQTSSGGPTKKPISHKLVLFLGNLWLIKSNIFQINQMIKVINIK
jgi:hypothetical protein